MAGRITRKTKNFEKLIKKIKLLSKSRVDSGYFAEQGDHPTADMPYAKLATILELKKKSVRTPTIFDMGSYEFKNDLHTGLKKYLYGDIKLSNILDGWGEHMSDIATSYFGRPSSSVTENSERWASKEGLRSPSGANTPLIFDGYLVDAWSYRTTQDRTIKR